MIIVCEPQCKAFSHEKFNSGFLYGLRMAFPGQKICFYGDASHIAALQKMLTHDRVSIENMEYRPVRFRTSQSLLRIVGYVRLLLGVLRETRAAGADKIFFLSFNPEILYLLKTFKKTREFRMMKFTLVLHGGFESIAPDSAGTGAPARPAIFNERSLFEKIRRTKLTDIPARTLSVFHRVVDRLFSPWRALSRRLFTEKEILLWRHSGDFRYISLSPHATRNARRYLDVERLNFHTVILPMIFADVRPPEKNQYAKFAMFGYGDSLALRELLNALSNRKIDGAYEIRVIGMDNRGIEGFANATSPSAGKPLQRREMESYAIDIDMFLILYDKSRYRLTCSGSIMEALSYLKPVLHLDNECMNNFNRVENPIGIRCDNISELADKLLDIVEHYTDYAPALDRFRQNMLEVRRECSIEQSVDALRASFTW